jgi:hypothetical protein
MSAPAPEPRYSMRARNSSTSNNAASPIRQTLITGWDAFKAAESTNTKSGTTETNAVLNYNGKDYPGKAGAGHAEMKALADILAGEKSLDAIIKNTVAKTVECTAKPCCYRCSIVLGLLGFKAKDDKTMKTKSGMGGTQWYMASDLATALEKAYPGIFDVLNVKSNYDDL